MYDGVGKMKWEEGRKLTCVLISLSKGLAKEV